MTLQYVGVAVYTCGCGQKVQKAPVKGFILSEIAINYSFHFY